ncbi:MAG: exonuclease SbcCD subunit D C-terminal domain-containing protein [Planctomycetota bacterium]
MVGDMRILHTSDWHLGHSLHGQEQSAEHAAFLAWLLEQIEALAPDALLITGDVYETTTPPIAAERAFLGFLADAARARPGLQTVVLAGNHDSPARLAAPTPLLERWGVRIVASARPEGAFKPERLVIGLREADAPEGPVKAWLAAVPFVRPADVPPGASYAEGAAEVHRDVLAAARARRKRGQALVVAAHGTLVDAERTATSERPVAGGHDALPRELFADDVSYVALGHLHRAQEVGRNTIRYAGSPIPLSFAEVDYPHQVLAVEVRGKRQAAVEVLEVPRTRPMLRVPAAGPGPLADVLEALRGLPALEDLEGPRPWLEVRVELEGPEPDLRALIDEALAGRAAQLVALKVSRVVPASAALAEVAPQARLTDLAPREVFERLCQRTLEAEPSSDLMSCYDQLVAEARALEGDPLPAAEDAPVARSSGGAGWTAAVRAPRTSEVLRSTTTAASAPAPAAPRPTEAAPVKRPAAEERDAPETATPEPGAFGPLFAAARRSDDRGGAA